MPEVWENKKYKLEKSENFDDYMKALGVGLVLRKMGNTITPTVELKKNGDEYTLATSSKFKSSSITFKLEEEFEQQTLDGRKVKSVCSLDGTKLIEKQLGAKPTTITREFTDCEMKATFLIDDIKATRVYKAAPGSDVENVDSEGQN